MKNAIVLSFFTVLLLTACSKSSVDDSGTGSATIVAAGSVPQAARTALATNFSGATEIEWQRHSSSSFEAQFNHTSQRHSARFDDNGRQSSHSIQCIDGPVPQVVLDAFRQRFTADNVYEWKLRNDGTWKAHFMRGAIKYEATYTATGTLLKFEQA
jgi:major membrane immunogen (membrane-anchored lipoprotein)